MSRIYWDSMLFIYWLEDHPVHFPRVQAIFERMQERGDVLCSSSLTLGEVLTAPFKFGKPEAAARVREFFYSSGVELLSFTPETAEHFGRIRASHNVSPPDAIHLACAAQAKTDLFLTNDDQLRRLVVPGIQFIAGMNSDLL